MGSPETSARAFLKEYRKLFSMKNNLSDLRYKKSVKNKFGLHRVTFQQLYKGIPIEEATYKVHISKENQVIMANGFYYPNINVSIIPKLDDKQAIIFAKEDLKLNNIKEESNSAKLVIFPKNDGTISLAWKTTIQVEQPNADWIYFVDAHTGIILEKQNQLMKVVGNGNIYPTHPGLSTVTSKDLYRLDGNGFLQGAYVHVVNDVASEAYSANHDFSYSTSSTHFDEVNLYYHIDKFRVEFINNLGNPGLGQITAHAHSNYDLGPNNAWFDRNEGELFFGDGTGTGYNPFAREDKAIYHEYTHAIIFSIQSGITGANDDEEGAISEGTSDYFPGAFTGRTLIFDYSASGHQHLQRDMVNPGIESYDEYEDSRDNKLPVGKVESHIGGEFFSAILWDLRNHPQIETSKADFLVFDALSGVSGNPDFIEFRDAMMASDDIAYGGEHNDLIQDAFAYRGIGQLSPYTVSISGPENMIQGSSSDFVAFPNGGISPYLEYNWYYKHYNDPQWTAVNANPPLGDTYNHTAGAPPGEYIKVVVYDSEGRKGEGTHFFTIMGFGKIVSNKKLPKEFEIQQNYPNPFNPSTIIPYALPERSNVTLQVYNILGRKVAILVNKTVGAGFHEATFDGQGLSSGLYLVRFRAKGISGETFSRDMKVQLIK